MHVSDGGPRAFRALQWARAARPLRCWQRCRRGFPGDAGPRCCSSRPSASGLPSARALRRQLRGPRGRGPRPRHPPARLAGRRDADLPDGRRGREAGRETPPPHPRERLDIAQLSLAYTVAALFATALHAGGAGGVTVLALVVAVLLVFFFVNTGLVFAYLELSGLGGPHAPARDRPLPAGALLLLAPMVVLEVLVYPHYGAAGALLAFFPVALAAVVMRNLSSMEQRVREVSRQNRELDVMRDISNTFGVSARVDRYETRVRRARATPAGRGHGAARVERRRRRGPRRAPVRGTRVA